MNAYEQLKAELDRTAVISSDFKGQILGWAQHIASEAFDRGRKQGHDAAMNEAQAAFDRGKKEART